MVCKLSPSVLCSSCFFLDLLFSAEVVHCGDCRVWPISNSSADQATHTVTMCFEYDHQLQVRGIAIHCNTFASDPYFLRLHSEAALDRNYQRLSSIDVRHCKASRPEARLATAKWEDYIVCQWQSQARFI